MLKLARLVFNALQENTYILSDDSGEAVIVDAGNYSDRENRTITQYLETNSLKPVMLLNTHGHIDHIVGVDYLKEFYGIPFAASSEDDFLISTAKVHGRLYGFDLAQSPSIDIDISKESVIKFGESSLEIIHTPGHSPGGVCIYNKESRILITGDTLFRGSIGRTDLPGGDYNKLMRSILGKIVPLGADVSIFPGHGESSTIGHEVENNPFIAEVIEGEVNFEA